jgi:hypothetical protein
MISVIFQDTQIIHNALIGKKHKTNICDDEDLDKYSKAKKDFEEIVYTNIKDILVTIKNEINGCSLTTVISSTRKTTANNSNKSVREIAVK